MSCWGNAEIAGPRTPHESTLTMPTAHALVWLDHLRAKGLRIGEETHDTTFFRDEKHDPRQHNSAVRTQHEFFGAVKDALVEFTRSVVTGSGQRQMDSRHYVSKHHGLLRPVLAGREKVTHPTDPELIARSTVDLLWARPDDRCTRARVNGPASILLCHDGHSHEPDQHGAGTT